jgi:hypothetical protein
MASENIKAFYKEFQCNWPRCLKLTDLTDTLQSEFKTVSKVFLIVDALNECLETVEGGLIVKLGYLASTVHLLVTPS